MLWTFKGKHEGKDVNDVPKDYLEWAAEKSKNPEARALAQKVLDYQNRGSIGSSNNTKTSTGTSESGLRAKVLELAIQMDTKNPWPYLKPVKDYIETGQLPNLSSMLGTEEPKPKQCGGDAFDLASDDEPPF